MTAGILQNLNMSGVQHSTLDVLYAGLKSAVGHYLFGKRSETDWGADQLESIQEAVKSGVRQTYFPPAIGGESHSWTWLKPTTTLTTVDGTSAYELPGTFAGLIGYLTYDSDNGYARIPVTGEGRIRAMQAGSSLEGKPVWACIRPKSFDALQPQLFEIEFYPTPDGAYTLTYRYVALADGPTDNYPFVLGGATCAETIRLSCLAAAEEMMNDQRGEKWARFMTALDGSISLDRMLAPSRLGCSYDNSDNTVGRYRHNDDITVTHEGTAY